MPAFNVTTTPTSLSLKAGESGTLVVVVSNRMGRPFLARVDPKPTPLAAAAWITPPPVTQRQFEADPAATYNFEFTLQVPADAKAQAVQVRFDVVDPQVPDDPLAQGETVAVNVLAKDAPAPVKKPGIPWWVWVVAGAVVLGVGIGIKLLIGKPDRGDEMTDLIACTASGGDMIDRGFYVSAYPGATLNQVDLYLSGSGTITIRLTAHAARFDAAPLGTAEASVDFSAAVAGSPTTFDFGSVPVTPGSLVAFKMTRVGGTASTAYYDVSGVAPADCPVVQTNGSAPPLDTFRRNGIGITVRGAPADAP